MLDVARWCCCLLLPHCSVLGCATLPCLGKVLYKLHRGCLIVWESEPGQEDLTALATGVPPAWEVGVGGGEVVHSCRVQITEMTRLQIHRRKRHAQSERKGMHGVKGYSEIICVPSTSHRCLSSFFVKVAK